MLLCSKHSDLESFKPTKAQSVWKWSWAVRCGQCGFLSIFTCHLVLLVSLLLLLLLRLMTATLTIKMLTVQDILCLLQVCHSIISALFTDLSGRGSKSLLKIWDLDLTTEQNDTWSLFSAAGYWYWSSALLFCFSPKTHLLRVLKNNWYI